MMIKRLAAIFLCLVATWTGAMAGDISQATNRANWRIAAGIEGGIPYRDVVYTNLVPGLTTAEFNAVLVQCATIPHRIVMMGAGTYDFGTIVAQPNVEVKAATTNVLFRMSGAVQILGPGGRSLANISSGANYGSVSINVATTPTGLTPGMQLWISETNNPLYVSNCGMEGGFVACDVYLDDPDHQGLRIRQQGVRVTGVAGNTITFWPPLEGSYTIQPRAAWAPTLQGFGVHNITFTNATSTTLLIQYAQDIYATNCTFHHIADEASQIAGFWTHRVNVQHCTFVGYGYGASAVVPYVMNEGWLVEDNIFIRENQVFLVVGPGGRHVFGYNFTESTANSTSAMINEVGAHGGYPEQILCEGNVMWKFQNDLSHGNSGRWTLHRNQIKGRKPGSTFGEGMIFLDHTNWWCSITGNVLGYPGIQTNDIGWLYDYESDGNNTPSVPRAVILYRYALAGYWEFAVDPHCKTSTLRHGNYDYLRNQVEWDAGISDHDLPLSYYRPGKPPVFGKLPCPAIGPDVPGYRRTYANAAEYRYYTGKDPEPEARHISTPKGGVPRKRSN